MKTFVQYLTESQKTYEFRIKIANCDPAEHMDRLENALEAYGLDSISKPKRLPISESNIDFPSMKNAQVWLMDAVLKYPTGSEQIRAIISERAGFPQSCVMVVPRNHPEVLWRENEGELREFKAGDAVLDKPLEDSPEGKKLGQDYAKAHSLLKELSKPEVAAEGGKTDGAQTLNDIPQGNISPLGSKQNKIPSPVKGR